MLAHDWLDSLGGFIGVVEWDGANIVVKDVGLDNAVEKSAADEAELTVNGCSSSSDVVPALTGIVRKRAVGVLKKSDGNCEMLEFGFISRVKSYIPSQWLTHK